MKDKNHTPVPWKAVHLGRNRWQILAASPHISGLWQTVAELNGPWKAKNYKENAELIVRAVNSHEELLEALKQLDEAHNHETLCRAKEKARAAIAKAQGRKPC